MGDPAGEEEEEEEEHFCIHQARSFSPSLATLKPPYTASEYQRACVVAVEGVNGSRCRHLEEYVCPFSIVLEDLRK